MAVSWGFLIWLTTFLALYSRLEKQLWQVSNLDLSSLEHPKLTGNA
jgi:hypothetical protein